MLPPAVPSDSPLSCWSPGRLSVPGHTPQETGSRARSHFVRGKLRLGARPGVARGHASRTGWGGRGAPSTDPSPVEGHSRRPGVRLAFTVWLRQSCSGSSGKTLPAWAFRMSIYKMRGSPEVPEADTVWCPRRRITENVKMHAPVLEFCSFSATTANNY